MENLMLLLIAHLPDLLDLNLTVSVVVLFVIAVRTLLKNAPRVFSYALWCVVLLRLLVPVSIESPLSFVPERHEFSSMVDVNAVLPDFRYEAPADAAQNSYNLEQSSEGEAEALAGSLLTPQTYLTFLWLGGMAVMLLWGFSDWLRLRLRLRTAVPDGGGIFLSDTIPVPFVMGLFRPEIYLPASIKQKERELILLHERCHIRRCDHMVKWLYWVALCIHWFNPFVWAAFILAGRDMEMSCDEAVLRELDPGLRPDYAASLLNFATGRSRISATPLAFGDGNPKSRIENIVRWKKPKVWVIILCCLFCAGLAVCLLTDPEIPEPEKTIDFVDLNTDKVTQAALRNVHNGEMTFITDPDEVGEICAIVRSVWGFRGISGKGYYEGSYSVTLYSGEEEVFSIVFGDSDAFYHGVGEDGYPIRYELEGLTAGGIIRLLSRYDQSGFDWGLDGEETIPKDILYGTWQTRASILGEGIDPETECFLALVFDGHGNGIQEQIIGSTTHSDPFSYRLKDGILHLEFERQQFDFSFEIQGTKLILIQNHIEVIYEKVN